MINDSITFGILLISNFIFTNRLILMKTCMFVAFSWTDSLAPPEITLRRTVLSDLQRRIKLARILTSL